eukprot:TRINITY_DN28276_c0_g4_i1.p1 TRINITY_DN28276_c0_g4~~TRINITY_DN28276_c0_g4_i1.p1  ORF type:complete len:1893 (+),score=339.27 TRINITY_DN28276_c0_g4_i1:101-5779(+)
MASWDFFGFFYCRDDAKPASQVEHEQAKSPRADESGSRALGESAENGRSRATSQTVFDLDEAVQYRQVPASSQAQPLPQEPWLPAEEKREPRNEWGCGCNAGDLCPEEVVNDEAVVNLDAPILPGGIEVDGPLPHFPELDPNPVQLPRVRRRRSSRGANGASEVIQEVRPDASAPAAAADGDVASEDEGDSDADSSIGWEGEAEGGDIAAAEVATLELPAELSPSPRTAMPLAESSSPIASRLPAPVGAIQADTVPEAQLDETHLDEAVAAETVTASGCTAPSWLASPFATSSAAAAAAISSPAASQPLARREATEPMQLLGSRLMQEEEPLHRRFTPPPSFALAPRQTVLPVVAVEAESQVATASSRVVPQKSRSLSAPFESERRQAAGSAEVREADVPQPPPSSPAPISREELWRPVSEMQVRGAGTPPAQPPRRRRAMSPDAGAGASTVEGAPTTTAAQAATPVVSAASSAPGVASASATTMPIAGSAPADVSAAQVAPAAFVAPAASAPLAVAVPTAGSAPAVAPAAQVAPATCVAAATSAPAAVAVPAAGAARVDTSAAPAAPATSIAPADSAPDAAAVPTAQAAPAAASVAASVVQTQVPKLRIAPAAACAAESATTAVAQEEPGASSAVFAGPSSASAATSAAPAAVAAPASAATAYAAAPAVSDLRSLQPQLEVKEASISSSAHALPEVEENLEKVAASEVAAAVRAPSLRDAEEDIVPCREVKSDAADASGPPFRDAQASEPPRMETKESAVSIGAPSFRDGQLNAPLLTETKQDAAGAGTPRFRDAQASKPPRIESKESVASVEAGAPRTESKRSAAGVSTPPFRDAQFSTPPRTESKDSAASFGAGAPRTESKDSAVSDGVSTFRDAPFNTPPRGGSIDSSAGVSSEPLLRESNAKSPPRSFAAREARMAGRWWREQRVEAPGVSSPNAQLGETADVDSCNKGKGKGKSAAAAAVDSCGGDASGPQLPEQSQLQLALGGKTDEQDGRESPGASAGDADDGAGPGSIAAAGEDPAKDGGAADLSQTPTTASPSPREDLESSPNSPGREDGSDGHLASPESVGELSPHNRTSPVVDTPHVDVGDAACADDGATEQSDEALPAASRQGRRAVTVTHNSKTSELEDVAQTCRRQRRRVTWNNEEAGDAQAQSAAAPERLDLRGRLPVSRTSTLASIEESPRESRVGSGNVQLAQGNRVTDSAEMLRERRLTSSYDGGGGARDSFFGISEEQLAQLRREYEQRERMLSDSSDTGTCSSCHDSEYGLGVQQLTTIRTIALSVDSLTEFERKNTHDGCDDTPTGRKSILRQNREAVSEQSYSSAGAGGLSAGQGNVQTSEGSSRSETRKLAGEGDLVRRSSFFRLSDEQLSKLNVRKESDVSSVSSNDGRGSEIGVALPSQERRLTQSRNDLGGRDSNFGISDEQLERLRQEYDWLQQRERKISDTTSDGNSSRSDADFGLDTAQLSPGLRASAMQARRLTPTRNNIGGRDSNFGLSEEQLAQLRREYDWSQQRERRITDASSEATSNRRDSDFGLSSMQLGSSQTSNVPARRLTQTRSNIGGRDSNFGLSEEQLAQLRREYDWSQMRERKMTENSDGTSQTCQSRSDSEFGLGETQLMEHAPSLGVRRLTSTRDNIGGRDSNFGISEDQLEQLRREYDWSQQRERILTESSSEPTQADDSDYGLGSHQLSAAFGRSRGDSRCQERSNAADSMSVSSRDETASRVRFDTSSSPSSRRQEMKRRVTDEQEPKESVTSRVRRMRKLMSMPSFDHVVLNDSAVLRQQPRRATHMLTRARSESPELSSRSRRRTMKLTAFINNHGENWADDAYGLSDEQLELLQREYDWTERRERRLTLTTEPDDVAYFDDSKFGLARVQLGHAAYTNHERR